MSITDQLEEERRMLARLDDEDLAGLSTTVRDALTALPLRNAQVEAVLKEVAETEEDIRAQQRKGGGNDYMDGLAEMCRDIRRTIEEAGNV